jgi:hypothetical protein
MNFILLNPQSSRAGLQPECIGDEALCVSTMEDILFDRRTGTLAARISALTMYARWASSRGIPPNLVTPMQGELTYRCVCMLHSESLPATRASRFREAIELALHILADANVEALNSKRITGASLRSLGRNKMLLQKDPMRVE